MSVYFNALASFAAELALQAPARVVTRTLKDLSLYSQAERDKGIFTVLGAGIRSWPNGTSERIGEDGRQVIQVLGQIELAEGVDGPTADAAEFAMLGELIGLVQRNDLPRELQGLYPGSMQQSQQLELPVAWIAVEFENWALVEDQI